MTYEQFKANLKTAGLSVKGLAELLEMEPKSITNYKARGKVPRHLAVIVTLLAALRAHGEGVDELLTILA